MKDKTFNKPIVRSLIRPDAHMGILHALCMFILSPIHSLLVYFIYLLVALVCLVNQIQSPPLGTIIMIIKCKARRDLEVEVRPDCANVG